MHNGEAPEGDFRLTCDQRGLNGCASSGRVSRTFENLAAAVLSLTLTTGQLTAVAAVRAEHFNGGSGKGVGSR